MTKSDTRPRSGCWMLTFTGRKFYPLYPEPEDFFIEDIAHALAHICRFGGHTKKFYSVAEHSIRVAEMAPKEFKLCALLHDAAEAYIGDMIYPLKECMPEFQDAEALIWSALAKRFNLPEVMPPEVKAIDDRMLLTERRELLTQPVTASPWFQEQITTPYGDDYVILAPLAPKTAERSFLAQFEYLTQ